jgi:hypothetical protein
VPAIVASIGRILARKRAGRLTETRDDSIDRPKDGSQCGLACTAVLSAAARGQ